MGNKILHIMNWDRKFVPAFIRFVQQNFDAKEHYFIIYGPGADDEIIDCENVTYYPSLLKRIRSLWMQMRVAPKIILHGLFSSHLFYILALHPWVLKKCYWTIWGGDLYIRNTENRDWRWFKNEVFRRFVIRRIGHFVSQVKGDYDLAMQWYGVSGKWHECFMYPSNLYRELPVHDSPHDGLNILLGNSADPSNNHKEVLDKLRSYATENIRIYCPLSYGDQKYAQIISDYGRLMFGEKFLALRDFMPFDAYLELLSVVDVGIFNHKRQQGMGNITTLLGLGKKVFIRSDITSWRFLQYIGVTVFDVDLLDIGRLSKEVADNNRNIIAEYFSEKELIGQLQEIFE